MGDLRYRILSLLADYNSMGYGVPFSVIYKSYPTKTMKNVSMQLSYLKGKGWVRTTDTKCNYSYFLTEKGVQYLAWLNAKKRRKELLEVLDLEVQLYNSFM